MDVRVEHAGDIYRRAKGQRLGRLKRYIETCRSAHLSQEKQINSKLRLGCALPPRHSGGRGRTFQDQGRPPGGAAGGSTDTTVGGTKYWNAEATSAVQAPCVRPACTPTSTRSSPGCAAGAEHTTTDEERTAASTRRALNVQCTRRSAGKAAPTSVTTAPPGAGPTLGNE